MSLVDQLSKLYTASCLPIGIIIFAWTSVGRPFTGLVLWLGQRSLASPITPFAWPALMQVFYLSLRLPDVYTVQYMICVYGAYAASATGGNGWSRDFLARVLTAPATAFYTNTGGPQHLQTASTILFCISLVLVCAVFSVCD